MSIPILYSFKDIPTNSRIGLYGAGETGDLILKEIKYSRPDLSIICFFDSFKSGIKSGLPINSFSNKIDITSSIDFIIITSVFWIPISQNLINNGFSKFFILSNKLIYDTSQLKSHGSFYFSPKEFNIVKHNFDGILNLFDSTHDQKLFHALINIRKGDESSAFDFFYNLNLNQNQYIDFIRFKSIKSIIEAGIFDGSDTIKLYEKATNLCDFIGFEPLLDNFKNGSNYKFFNSLDSIQIYPFALYNINTKLTFYINDSGSSFNGNGSESFLVNAIKLDDFVLENNIKKIDYIKMDIEGSEIDALTGASNTIFNHRPQIAISLYHKKEHLYEIPLLLSKLMPNSSFHLGQYTSTFVDTVLYVIPNELH